MKYERPLPDGMEEPDPDAVETAAVLKLVLLLIDSWSDEKLEKEMERVGRYRHGYLTDYVDDDVKLQRRSSERAADILNGVLALRQDHAASIAPQPDGLWSGDDEEA